MALAVDHPPTIRHDNVLAQAHAWAERGKAEAARKIEEEKKTNVPVSLFAQVSDKLGHVGPDGLPAIYLDDEVCFFCFFLFFKVFDM